jgi:hypothetical protein
MQTAILGMSFKTAACHRQHLLAKTGAANTAGLRMFAVGSGLAEGSAPGRRGDVPVEEPRMPAAAPPAESDRISRTRANHQRHIRLLEEAVSEGRVLQERFRVARDESWRPGRRCAPPGAGSSRPSDRNGLAAVPRTGHLGAARWGDIKSIFSFYFRRFSCIIHPLQL